MLVIQILHLSLHNVELLTQLKWLLQSPSQLIFILSLSHRL
jgi:hypothetical protein